MQKDHNVQKQYLLYEWSWEVAVARFLEGEPKVIINNKGEISGCNQGR